MKTITILKMIALLSSLGLVACGGGGGGGTPASSTTTSGTTTTTTTPPSVKSFTPANNSTGVLTNAKLSVTFNVDMDQTTITDSDFTLSGANTVKGQIAYNTATRTATFTPDAPLKPGTVYTVSLTTSITDSTGTALTKTYQTRFTTETFIRRVSVDSKGTEADDSSFTPDVSADGRYVVFMSTASNLVSNDTLGYDDIFIHDTQTGNTTRVSESKKKVEANGKSSEPAISADGRYVVFQSLATNLIDGSTDNNNHSDVFVYNTQDKSIKLVSVDNTGTGTPGKYSSTQPSISDDGRYISFTSRAKNLVAVDTNNSTDIFVRDTLKGNETTTLVSVDNSGNQASGRSEKSHISGNGLHVTFVSKAKLDPKDTNGIADIYVRDLKGTGTTTRISISNTVDVEPNSDSDSPSISADGRYVAFTSMATNLLTTGTDNNGNTPDIFVRDTQKNTTTLVSVSNSSNSTGIKGASFDPAISADGRYVVFQSDATNLLSTADTNSSPDVFVRDTTANTTIRVNVDKTGAVGTFVGITNLANPAISADGRYVVFNIDAALTPSDGNGANDIFRVLNAKP